MSEDLKLTILVAFLCVAWGLSRIGAGLRAIAEELRRARKGERG